MNINTLVFDLMRSKWLINTDNIAEYEKLANRFITGDYKGESIDREAFKASYMAATNQGYGVMKQDEKNHRTPANDWSHDDLRRDVFLRCR